MFRRPRFHLARPLIYSAAFIAAVVIAITSAAEPAGQRLVAARQLFGLCALGLLLASISIGPVFAVFPRLPLRSLLMYGRRAVGIACFIYAVLHVGCYLWPLLGHRWRELFAPGASWVAGLILGLVALTGMSALALTSTDAAVKRLGGRAWKRLHRTIYIVLVVVLVHAVLVGSDFGVARPADAHGEPDAGALVGFTSIALALGVLLYLRRKGIKFATAPAARQAG